MFFLQSIQFKYIHSFDISKINKMYRTLYAASHRTKWCRKTYKIENIYQLTVDGWRGMVSIPFDDLTEEWVGVVRGKPFDCVFNLGWGFCRNFENHRSNGMKTLYLFILERLREEKICFSSFPWNIFQRKTAFDQKKGLFQDSVDLYYFSREINFVFYDYI